MHSGIERGMKNDCVYICMRVCDVCMCTTNPIPNSADNASKFLGLVLATPCHDTPCPHKHIDTYAVVGVS